MLQNEIRKAKAIFSNEKLNEHKSDLKKLWKTLKGLGFNSNTCNSNPILLEQDGILIHDFETVAIINYIIKMFYYSCK